MSGDRTGPNPHRFRLRGSFISWETFSCLSQRSDQSSADLWHNGQEMYSDTSGISPTESRSPQQSPALTFSSVPRNRPTAGGKACSQCHKQKQRASYVESSFEPWLTQGSVIKNSHVQIAFDEAFQMLARMSVVKSADFDDKLSRLPVHGKRLIQNLLQSVL